MHVLFACNVNYFIIVYYVYLYRSGFTCKVCTRLLKRKRNAETSIEKEEVEHWLRQHLQQQRESREKYSDNIYLSQTLLDVASWALDAADQSKHNCPLLSCPGRNVGVNHRIVQQFIGTLDHNKGYILYRKLPVIKKGANVTLTILVDMISNGHLKGIKQLFLQWDGASENVNYTNTRFCTWLLLLGEYPVTHCI